MASAPVLHVAADPSFADDLELRDELIEDLTHRVMAGSVATQDALAAFLPSADPFQARVIDATEFTIRMVAPAGSGKTQTVINRVLRRVRDGLNPERVLVLTFDNAAAGALRDRLASEVATLPPAAADALGRIRISTLNAYGYRLLRDLFPGEHREIADGGWTRRSMSRSLEALGDKSRERRAALPAELRASYFTDLVGLLKNELLDPRALDAQACADWLLASPPTQVLFPQPDDRVRVMHAVQAVIWLHQKHEAELQAAQRMDFDDQKLRAFRCLVDAPLLLASVRSALGEVVVDEFQDINRLDFAFITTIARDATLVVTGDDDQAIYGFRGCSPEYIINLERHLGRQVTSHELRTNYRCPANIVRHADRLIRHNTFRIPKDPIAHRTDESAIRVVSSRTSGLEARWMVRFARRLLGTNHSLRASDLAVLYRTNAQSLPLQVELILADMPFQVRPEDNILRREEIDRLLAVLRVKHAVTQGRPQSRDDQVGAIRAYFRYLDQPSTDELRAITRDRGDIRALLEDPRLSRIPRVDTSRVREHLRDVLAEPDLLATLDLLGRGFRGLQGMVGSVEDAVDSQVPLAEIGEVAANVGGGLEDFLTIMERAVERARVARAGDAADGLQLLTYFRAKGRQWHTVFLTGCNEGLIPHARAPVEDERRLFYVALTRASANLLISHVHDTLGTRLAPSRFLAEAGLL